MFKHCVLFVITVGLVGCPDVDQYAKDDQEVDASTDIPDRGQPSEMDQSIEPADDQGMNADIDASASGDASNAGDAGTVGDAQPTVGDAGTGDSSILAPDSGIPAECTVEFEVTIPNDTPEGTLYVAGRGFDAPEWEPAVDSLALTRQENLATLSLVRPHLTRIEYKFTRGSWESVEGTSECENIEDRAVVVDCVSGAFLIENDVLNWIDQCSP